jgi:soluble lytic murein transglycosylase
MPNSTKLEEPTTVQNSKTSSTSSSPQINRRRRLNFYLAFTALLVSLVLVALGVYFFFNAEAGNRSSARQTAAAINKTTGPGSTAEKSPLVEDVYPTPELGGFGLKPDAGPTPTAIPATNEAARLRSLADEFYSDGRPVDAAAQYRLILDQYASSSEAPAALFGLARTGIDRGRFDEAADNFKKFINQYPNNPLVPYAYFYLGLTYKDLSQWDNALTYFTKYQSLNPGQMPLDGYASDEIAGIYDSTSKTTQAFDTYKKVADSAVTNLTKVTAMEKVGDDYLKANDTPNALAWYAKVLEVAKVPDYRASILVKEAKALEATGQPDKAADIYRQILDELVDTTTGFNTLKTLYNNNSPVLNDYFKGYYLYKAGVPDQAIVDFARFLGRPDEKSAQPPTPPNLSGGGQERFLQAWYLLAVSVENTGDTTRAISEYLELWNRFPQGQTAPQALSRLAHLTEVKGNSGDAMNLYGQVLQNYPSNPLAEDALLNQIRLAMAKGPDNAQPYADLLLQKFPASRSRSQVFYQLGKAYQTANNVNGTRNAFQMAVNSPTTDYFAIRASERLNDAYNPNTPPASTPATHPAVFNPHTFAADLERDRVAMESWLIAWAVPAPSATATPTVTVTITPTTTPASSASDSVKTTPSPAATTNPLDVAHNNLKSDPGLRRLADLKMVGLTDWATREAKELVDKYNDSPLELYFLALTLNEQGEYYYSITAAQRLLAIFQAKNPTAGLRTLPLLLQKLIYPLAYQQIILEQAKRQNFDPLLMVALVKQESAFDPDATSSVGAIGLTQVMPDTGKGIATNLDKPSFQNSDLYRPYTALEFGAYYLAARLKDFDGNPYQALAAYNGGAGNVYRWNDEAPSTTNFDNWLDNIDFPETRTYVEIIYANYYMYRQIYAAR